MNKKELLEYIKSRRYLCCFCQELQLQVAERGLVAINEYSGIICGGVEDMKIRYAEIKSN